ncbi:MAG: DUF3267 domain-containing protein [Clostridia bacterium]|nr:DUF3267 domain-containing protein [Clostridia bacterium]
MGKRYAELPAGYRESFSIDLQKNRKEFWTVNLLSAVLAIVVLAAGLLLVPFREAVRYFLENSLRMGRLLILLAAMFIYIILHEAVHGVTMKAVGTPKVKFGFTGAFAYAGSSDYYAKIPYLWIAVMPVLFFGILFLALSLAVDRSWFWTVHLLQVINVSGAAGDLYVMARLLGREKTILVKDTGTAMQVYEKTE